MFASIEPSLVTIPTPNECAVPSIPRETIWDMNDSPYCVSVKGCIIICETCVLDDVLFVLFSKEFIIYSMSTPFEVLSMSSMPIEALESVLNDIVSIKLKDQRIFRGRLTRCDVYMNLTLADAEEVEEEQIKAKYGSVLIRGNNILWIQLPPE
jgi:small nuclear ribonucleoprotein